MTELYIEKIRLMREVLELTQSAEFKGNDEDVDTYVDLMAARDELFDRAKQIDEELKGYPGDSPEAKEYSRELSLLAKQIIAQDNYMAESVTKILNGTKTDIKNIKAGKALTDRYSHAAANPGVQGRDWS